MKNNKILNVGVIGVGSMGYHHARLYSQMPGLNLAGIADANGKLLKKVAAEYNTTGYTDYNELLELDLDAVNIAVPTSLHKEVALAAIENKIHVLIEKPIANDSESATEIIELAKKNSIKLMVGHVERFNPVITAIKSLLVKEDIISIDITRVGPLPPRITDVGIIIDLAIHDIDIIRYISNAEIADVYSVHSNVLANREDMAMLLFKMQNGIMAHVTTNWLTPYKARSIQIATKKKFIKGDLLTKKAQEYSRFSHKNNSYQVRDLSVPFAEPLRSELEAFINCIRQDTAEIPVSGQDGLTALLVAERCLGKG